MSEDSMATEEQKGVKKKKGCMGCSLPVAIILTTLILGMLVVGFGAGPLGAELAPGLNEAIPDWVKVSAPHVQLPAETVFHLFGFPISNSVTAAWLTMAVLIVFCVVVSRRMKIIPGRLQAAFEFLFGWVYDLCVQTAGEKNGRRFFPVVATVFMFVGFNAWLALLPGVGSITIGTAEGRSTPVTRSQYGYKYAAGAGGSCVHLR